MSMLMLMVVMLLLGLALILMLILVLIVTMFISQYSSTNIEVQSVCMLAPMRLLVFM